VFWGVPLLAVFARLKYSSVEKMAAVRSSETSVNFCLTTRRLVQEDSNFHSPRRGNVKSNEIQQCVFLNCIIWTSLMLRHASKVEAVTQEINEYFR
jgi:hypothetical protein